MEAVIIFDADNTLWDTDSVFRAAQLALLQRMVNAGLIRHAESELQTLRRVDAEIGETLGRAEYDFKILIATLAKLYSQRLSSKQDSNRIDSYSQSVEDSELSQIIEEAYEAFQDKMRSIPPLYPDTVSVLSSIRASSSPENPIVTIVLSEGNVDRLERILEAHNIWSSRYFDEIIITPKNKEAFERAKQLGLELVPSRGMDPNTLTVMVGDSMKRDIKFANQAGFITIYKPALFKGHEEPQEQDEHPVYTIHALEELLPILSDLGLPVETTNRNPTDDGAAASDPQLFSSEEM